MKKSVEKGMVQDREKTVWNRVMKNGAGKGGDSGGRYGIGRRGCGKKTDPHTKRTKILFTYQQMPAHRRSKSLNDHTNICF